MKLLKNKIKYILDYYFTREYLFFLKIIWLLFTSGKKKSHIVTLLKNKIIINDYTALQGMWAEIYLNKFYEFKTTNKTPVIIDCGSNIGISVLYFYQKYPNAKITCIEADPEIFGILKHNLENNNVKAVMINKAVWNTNDEKIKFGCVGSDSGSIYATSNIVEVETVRLKELLAKEERIDFLKIDIEGAETIVIKDCAEELKKVSAVFVEYHSFKNEQQKLDEILRVLSNSGFRYHIIPARRIHKPFVFDYSKLDMDLQLNIFGYRN